MPNMKFLVIDAMAVVQALIYAVKFKTCEDLGKAFAKSIDAELQDYMGGRVIFDNYDKLISIKEDIRYAYAPCDDFIVSDRTPIKDKKKFLASRHSKDSLTLFLADKLIMLCKRPVVTATRMDVRTNSKDIKPTTGVSLHEEADTLMMLHALEIANVETGCQIEFFTQDTVWWLIILRRLPQLGIHTGIVTGTRSTRRRTDTTSTYIGETRFSSCLYPAWFPCIDGQNHWCRQERCIESPHESCGSYLDYFGATRQW